ncbi:hypothetical protein pb186bvf_007260 [Paramecium bursaria]
MIHIFRFVYNNKNILDSNAMIKSRKRVGSLYQLAQLQFQILKLLFWINRQLYQKQKFENQEKIKSYLYKQQK